MTEPAYTAEEIQKAINYIEAGNKINFPFVEGYSTWKVRNLLNRLVGLRTNTHYLEIGVHLGSTFIPALFGNMTVRATAIDNWSLAGDLESTFRDNLKKHIPFYEKKVNIIHGDFREVDVSQIWSPVDVYFYDGDHGWDCQIKAFTHIAPALADQFIAIVDDVNWVEPREGTIKALNQLGYTIQHQWTLKGPFNGTNSEEEWWNSIWLGVIKK